MIVGVEFLKISSVTNELRLINVVDVTINIKILINK